MCFLLSCLKSQYSPHAALVTKILEERTNMGYFIKCIKYQILTRTRYQVGIVEEHNVGKPFDASWVPFVLSKGALKYGIRRL